MRSLEDFLRADVSEDDHPSTDTSEDSVEVSVSPVTRPNPAQIRRLPRKFRKAFEKDVPLALPADYSVPPFKTSPDQSAKGASPTPLGSPSLPSQKAKISRRKLTEPRRVVDNHNESTAGKRPHEHHEEEEEEEWTRRKALKGEDPLLVPDAGRGEAPPQPGILGRNPFIGHFVSPHLLIPPTWPHVARYPYTHLVGSVLGPPLGLLPTNPYPLLPILPPRAPPTSSPSASPCESFPLEDEKPVKINGVSLISPQVSTPDSPKSPPPVVSNRKFLSVESLLNDRIPKTEAHPVHSQVNSSEELPDNTQDEGEPLPPASSPSNQDTIQSLLQRQPKQKQRNYKNMTRERRIEANARERTRVHTISAAFETLRRAVPSFSHNQKLSKLSVLRIASAYILSLSRLAGRDYSLQGSKPTFEECVDFTSKTIQVEGKAKKKKR